MKQTNDTMKEMMVQQAATMNNLMAVIYRNEEQRYEGKASRVPQNINPTSTPADNTMTNSQQSMAQNYKKTKLQEDKDGSATPSIPTQQEPSRRKRRMTRPKDGRRELRDRITNRERPECRRRQRRRVSQEEYHDETMEKWEETNTYQTNAPSTHSNETCMNK